MGMEIGADIVTVGWLLAGMAYRVIVHDDGLSACVVVR